MTNLQEEICRLLPKMDCTARYDETTGHMNIDYEGTELLSLHADGIIHYKNEDHQTEQRREQYYKVSNLIHETDEYVRLYEQAPQMEAEGVTEYRRLATYNGIVMAGMRSEKYGYMFTTWNESSDRKHVDIGDYSPDYDYVKESFIARSGLIDKRRLFHDEQLKILYDSLTFTAENNDSLTYDQEQKFKKLMEQIEDVLPEVSAETPNQAFQQNM